MSQTNFFKIDRKLLDHSLWMSEKFSKGQAWIDLIGLVNHAPGYFFKRGIKVDVKRGQSGKSIKTLMSRWKWSRGKVVRFLNFLKNESMIDYKVGNQTTLITICNYELYQGEYKNGDKANRKANSNPNDQANGAQTVRQTESKQVTNNNEKKKKNEKNEKKKTYLENSDEFRVASFFYNNILKHKPDYKKPNLQTWAKEADFILRIDKRNIETLKKIIVWSQADERERIYTMSMKSVRRNFDMLEIKMNQEGKPRKPKFAREEEPTLGEIAAEMVKEADAGLNINFKT